MWTIIKWIMIICFGPALMAMVLRIGSVGAVSLAGWLDRWPLNPF